MIISVLLQVFKHLGASNFVERRIPVLASPQDGLRTPPELVCPSEALTRIQSQAGRAAAVAAATVDAEQSLQERAQFRELADTERRAFWVHRNARELLCQASAEAEQQGGPARVPADPRHLCFRTRPRLYGMSLSHPMSCKARCPLSLLPAEGVETHDNSCAPMQTQRHRVPSSTAAHTLIWAQGRQWWRGSLP